MAPYLLPLAQSFKMKSPFLKKDSADFFHKVVEQTLEARHEDKVNHHDNDDNFKIQDSRCLLFKTQYMRTEHFTD